MENELSNQKQETLTASAKLISALIRSLDSCEERVKALRNLTNIPDIEMLSIVNEMAVLNQDFESFEALKIYAEGRGMILQN